ncbi:MAG: DUF4270 family protein [Ginsengibacter sp.]
MFKCRFKSVLTGAIFLFLLNWNCTKIDTTQLGQGLIPVVDNINTFDTTIDVIAINYDSVTTECDSIPSSDLHALGVINNDPLFGNSSANIYVEFKPAAYPVSIPDTLKYDSAFIVLHYSHSYGDSMQPQKVQLYQLTFPFKLDSTYTTCDLLDYENSGLLGETIYTPKDLDDSIHLAVENTANEIRIRVDDNFIKALLSDTDALKTDSAFKEHLKGFAIIADKAFGGNALSYFDLTNVDSRLSMYFASTTAVLDTVIYDFAFTSLSGHANSIIRERGTSEITSHVTQPAQGDDFIYLQTSPGSYATLTIPGLSLLSNRVINHAELIAEQVYAPNTVDNFLTAPQLLYLDTKDTLTNGNYIPIPCDFTYISGQPNFTTFGGIGGIRKSATDGSGNSISKYVFNISRYVQTIVTKGSNNAVLRLRTPYNIYNPVDYVDRCNQRVARFNFAVNNIAEGRVKLYGTQQPNQPTAPQRMRLHIVYSLL